MKYKIVAAIDRDYIAEPDEKSRVGITFDSDYVDGPKVRFRCKDDDGEIYYGGWLINDSQGENQCIVLNWTMRDAGCTTIEVKIDDEWVQEIG